jgi:predicted esterase
MSDTRIRTIETRIHGRYLLKRTGAGDEPLIVVGFHGYGQAAEEIMDPLERIAGDHSALLVAVQALNRFYNVKARTVVASWMTQQDRELAIEDNVEYVSAVVDEVRRDLRGRTGPLLFVGFSQGSPMAYRAAIMSGHDCRGVIVLGGDLPPELTAEQLRMIPRVLVGRGSADEWFGHHVFQENMSRLESVGCPVTAVEFEGGHEWSDRFVAEAADFLHRTVTTT